MDALKNAIRNDIYEQGSIPRGTTITQQLAKNLYLSPSTIPCGSFAN